METLIGRADSCESDHTYRKACDASGLRVCCSDLSGSDKIEIEQMLICPHRHSEPHWNRPKKAVIFRNSTMDITLNPQGPCASEIPEHCRSNEEVAPQTQLIRKFREPQLRFVVTRVDLHVK
jgi:hypothetical protein